MSEIPKEISKEELRENFLKDLAMLLDKYDAVLTAYPDSYGDAFMVTMFPQKFESIGEYTYPTQPACELTLMTSVPGRRQSFL